jgi:hypothetical protein
MMRHVAIGLAVCSLLVLPAWQAWGAGGKGSVVKGIESEGSCAVVGMSAEQCQLMALQRARSAAIEQAAGVKVSASTVITNMRLAVDFIKTYATGYIVEEKVEWLPLGSYQRDSSSAPIPEYRVRIVADVYLPGRRVSPIGLSASLNRSNFRAGESAEVSVMVGRDAMLYIFNITADDRVMMLFPNRYEPDPSVQGGGEFVFPSRGSGIKLTLGTLPGHESDAEAVFVAAVDASMADRMKALFAGSGPMGLSAFFARYSEVADHAEDAVLPYEVVGGIVWRRYCPSRPLR